MIPIQIVVALAFAGICIMLLSVVKILRDIRRDIIAAGIDIHQELVEIKVHQRLMLIGKEATSAQIPASQGLGTPEESDVDWLARQRAKVRQ